jgi:hypothetical protein
VIDEFGHVLCGSRTRPTEHPYSCLHSNGLHSPDIYFSGRQRTMRPVRPCALYASVVEEVFPQAARIHQFKLVVGRSLFEGINCDSKIVEYIGQ